MGRLASIVITTYYRNDTLPEAIESALAQTYDPVEIVVVDDSDDRYAEPVVEDYDVKYVSHEENRGQIAAWQTGLEVTDGEYVQFLDDDDWLDRRKIASQVSLLDSDDDVGVAYCGLLFSDGRVREPSDEIEGDVFDLALTFYLPPCTTSSLLVRRQYLEQVTPLELYDAATDVLLKIELARVTDFGYVDEIHVYRNDSASSQGESVIAAKARRSLLQEYEEDYEQRPDWVRERAVATTLRFEGMVLWQEKAWSPRAIRNFAMVLLTAPDRRLTDLAALPLSLLGAPGHWLGSLLNRTVRRIGSTGNNPRMKANVTEYVISRG